MTKNKISKTNTVSNAENASVAALKKVQNKSNASFSNPSGRTRLSLGSGFMGERYGLDINKSISPPEKFSDKVELARKLYSEEGIVSTVIDLMVDFSATQMKNITDDEEVKEFFDNVCKYSDMDQVLRWVFWEYYMSGEVFPYRGEKKIVDSGEDAGKIYYQIGRAHV